MDGASVPEARGHPLDGIRVVAWRVSNNQHIALLTVLPIDDILLHDSTTN